MPGHDLRWLVLGLLLAAAGTALAAGDPEPDPAVADRAVLEQVIAARSPQERARDAARHPLETLEFCRVSPGMTVAELLPGTGWYTNILANYLGPEGVLYGVNFADRMWPLFDFATDDWVAQRIAATADFPDLVAGFTDNGIRAIGITVATVPPEAAGSVDRVLAIRALHNLNRFEARAGTRTQALAAIRGMLKPDGLVCVVQHRQAVPDSESGTDGSRGYMAQAEVIGMFEDAGFELADTSEINANPQDRPGPQDTVWRLPPTLRGSEDDPQRRAAMEAIGESDRMTLLFSVAPK